LLYKYYDSFTNDITEGDKNNCSRLEYDYDVDDDYYYYIYHNCCDDGFYPTTGWDPITGLGSINVDEFIAVFKKLTFSPTAAPATSPSKSLSTGAIVGIVIACIAGLILLIVGIVFLCHKRFSGPSHPALAAAGTMSPVSTAELVEKNDV